MSFEPLSPLSFLDRSAASFGARIAVVDGKRRWTYTELHNRCQRLAGALAPLAEGRPVAVLLPNNHVMLEVHFGVPWAGVPIVTINTRLSVGEVAYILTHCEAAVLIYDQSFDELISRLGQEMTRLPKLVRASEEKCQYEAMLDAAVPSAVYPSDERTIISINYTSGTTGRPKGVMYHHRGAYLQALAMVTHAGLTSRSAYLWTLPMFHCNGWTFPWACVAAATSQICLSKFDAAQAWSLIEDESVTALCGAPRFCPCWYIHPALNAAKPLRRLSPSSRVVRLQVRPSWLPRNPETYR
nr:AMP-binding protein [Pseudomonas cyclaminis]